MERNSYEKMLETGAIMVKFPKNAVFVEAHSFLNEKGEIVELPDHHTSRLYQKGPGAGYILRHFYGFSNEDRGQRCLAQVTILKKVVPHMANQQYIMLDIHKITDHEATSDGEVRFFEDGRGFSVIAENGEVTDYSFTNML